LDEIVKERRESYRSRGFSYLLCNMRVKCGSALKGGVTPE